MPLSEHEQRMLRQIERQFEHEHGLARALRTPVDPHNALRTAKRAALGFLVGLICLLVSFASSWLVGVVGFLTMLVSTVKLVQSVRRLLEDHWLRAAMRREGVEDVVPPDATLWQALAQWRAGRRRRPPAPPRSG